MLLLGNRQMQGFEITSPSFDMQYGKQQENKISFLQTEIVSNSKILGQTCETDEIAALPLSAVRFIQSATFSAPFCTLRFYASKASDVNG
jgi:hypothetical protein